MKKTREQAKEEFKKEVKEGSKQVASAVGHKANDVASSVAGESKRFAKKVSNAYQRAEDKVRQTRVHDNTQEMHDTAQAVQNNAKTLVDPILLRLSGLQSKWDGLIAGGTIALNADAINEHLKPMDALKTELQASYRGIVAKYNEIAEIHNNALSKNTSLTNCNSLLQEQATLKDTFDADYAELTGLLLESETNHRTLQSDSDLHNPNSMVSSFRSIQIATAVGSTPGASIVGGNGANDDDQELKKDRTGSPTLKS